MIIIMTYLQEIDEASNWGLWKTQQNQTALIMIIIIMAYFEEINQTAYEQLGSLEDSIDSYNLILSHKIGDFLNPADNSEL